MDIGMSVTKVAGVGPKTTEMLGKAGVVTVRDLLYYLPRAYENYQGASQIADIQPGKVIVRAKVEGAKTTRRRRNLAITEATLRDSSGAVRAVWFNQPYRAKQFVEGQEYYFAGEFGLSAGRYQLMNPAATAASDYDDAADKYQPIYKSCGELTSVKFAKIIEKLKPMFADIPEMLPERAEISRAEALFAVHFPDSERDVEKGRGYLAHEELFEMILAAALNKQENAKLAAVPVPQNLPKLREAVGALPYQLTGAQRRALWEIIQDMEQGMPMNRLLQGDVGSGKTVVAGLAALMAAEAGLQVAILAPTEILAAQHAETLHELLAPHGVEMALLTGSTKQKVALKKRIKSGEVAVVVGTHALLTDDTEFRCLALAVIDEQHRFGVRQRQKLLAKATTPVKNGERCAPFNVPVLPHLLSMTATPIPRSLQLTVFGDLTVGVLDELPKGRQAITTQIVSPNSLDQMWEAVGAEIAARHQCFYICKMIEEGSELSSVKREVERLRARFPKQRVEYLHGKMKAAEKDEIMGEFASGKIDILVSTTVVEVGVNVPNATVMVIADADRYGLAQLHQLRGRVGRGSDKAYCYLINSDSSKPTRRLREIERSQDGFYLAEVDLKLRGPGAIYGTLQHGVMDMRVASITDTVAIARAQKAVADYLQKGESLIEYRELSESVREYQKLTTLN